jgi:hypothetical protein
MRTLLACLMILFGCVTAARADAGRRVALVIGNGDYASVERLRNPINDARLIAGTLKELGFELVGGGPQTNLDKAGMTRAVQEFGRALAGADVALFYYSGHGLQVEGVNWLVPVDANPTRPQDLDFQMLDADLVLRQMQGAGTRLNIVILDACRNNPFAVRGLRSLGGGLAEMRAPEGTLISYATQPGAVAQDGDGANSPFSTALAQTMRQPGLDVFRTFNQVGLQVKRTTGGMQQPWVSNSPIDGEFAFAGLAPQAVPVIAPVPVVPAPNPAPRGVAPCPPVQGRAIRLPANPGAPTDAGCTTAEPVRPPAPTRPTPVRLPAVRDPSPRPPIRPAASGRCGDLLTRAQLGEPLSAADHAAMAGCAR